MIYVFLGIQLILIAISIWIIGAAFAVFFHWNQTLPFVPTGRSHAKRLLSAVNIQPDDSVVDIGAGWGTLVFKAAKHAKHVTAIEKAPLLTALMRTRRVFSKNKNHITIKRANAFNESYEPYSIVLGFWIPDFIRRIQPLLEKDLPQGAKIASYMFRLQSTKTLKEKKVPSKKDTIYLYEKVPPPA